MALIHNSQNTVLRSAPGEFTGVSTDGTLSGNGLNTPLGCLVDPFTGVTTDTSISGDGLNSPLGVTEHFSGVSTDSTMTGNGYDQPLGCILEPFSGVTTDSSMSGDGLNNPLGCLVEPFSGVTVDSSMSGDGLNTPLGCTATSFTGVTTDSNLSGDGAETPLGLSRDIVLENNGESAHITQDTIELLGGSSYGDPVIRARLGDIFISGAPGNTASPFVSVYGMAGVTLDGSDTYENITATASFKYSGSEFIEGYSSATMNANAITLTGRGQQGNYSTVIEDSGKLTKYDTNTAYSQYMDYHFTVSGDPTSTTHEIWSHYTAWPTDSGEYRQTKYGYDGVMVKSGIYDSGSHSASDYEAVLAINQLRISNKNSTAMVAPARLSTVTRTGDRVTAAGYLGDGWLSIYSGDYWSNNCRTEINGGPVAAGVTIEWSPSASGTFRNSGAGIFLRNWNPAVINESIAGMFIDCEGFEYHDHSLNQYYTGGDVWRSAAWYQNSWSIMSTGANHMGIVSARPANGHDEYGDNYWLTMRYQGWSTSGLNTKVAMYSERSAQYSYSGTRYVHDNGISASYTPTGMVFTSGGETLTMSFDKIKSLLALV